MASRPSTTQALEFLRSLVTTQPKSQLPHVSLEFDKRIALLTLKNGRRKNAMHPRMMLDLYGHVSTLENDPPNALVLSGEQGTFCAGLDLTASDKLGTSEAGAMMSVVMQDTLKRMRALSSVSVAAIEGYAVGGGAELALACDLRVFSSRALMRFVHARMAATPGWGGASHLLHAVGRSTAINLLCRMHPLNATDAMSFGLCNYIVDDNELKHFSSLSGWVVNKYLSMLHSDTPNHDAMRLKKLVEHLGMMPDMEDSLQYEFEQFKQCWGSKENRDAVTRALTPNKPFLYRYSSKNKAVL